MPLTLLLHGKHAVPNTPPPRYEPLGPWLVPWRFDGLEAEYEALRRGAGLVDYSTQAVVECRGMDRADFLQRILTNDIARLTPGMGCRAALLTPVAKLIAPLLVLADAEAHWLLCDLSRAAAVVKTLDGYLFTEQVTLTNHERRWAALGLQGPSALKVLSQVTGASLALAQPGEHAAIHWDDVPLRVISHTLTGSPGWLCLVSGEHADGVWHRLLGEDARHGLRPAGWEALSAARIEAGIPWFGVDMDETTLLPETGLERVAASDTKGCYVGQEIVARMQTYGSASKKLMGLLVEGKVVPQPGDVLRRGDEEVGRITSSCWSPALKRPIALGFLKRGAYAPDTEVEVYRPDARLPARVVALPFSPLRSA